MSEGTPGAVDQPDEAPAGGDEALDDLDLGDLDVGDLDVDVEGGLLLFSRQGVARRTPKVSHGARPPHATSALARLAQERNQLAAPVTVILAAEWLAEKEPDRFRRTSECEQGAPLRLEVRVQRTAAPDGTPATLQVFRHLPDQDEFLLTTLQGKVADGVIAVDWTCDLQLTLPPGDEPVHFEPKLSYKVECKGEEARAPFLAVTSFLEATVVDADGKPQEVDYALTLPQGRQRKGRTGPDGRLRVKVPPGRGNVTLGEAAPNTFVDFTCVDEESGEPIAVRYRLTLPNGQSRQGETGPDGRLHIDDVPPGDCELVFEEVLATAS